MRDTVDIRNFCERHKGQELALCTLVSKQGSVYRSLGAKKIVSRQKGCCGLLSGGCLEADIERTVCENWDELPFLRSFSTMSPEDTVFGYQSGCAGSIDILCEPLPQGFDDLDFYIPFGVIQKFAGVEISLAAGTLGKRRVTNDTSIKKDSFTDLWQAPIQLYVIGCGLDATPYYDLGQTMGWEVCFLDYRDSLRENLPQEARVVFVPLEKIADHITSGSKCAILLMTHNYQADLELLRALSLKGAQQFGYIGCLGPRQRFDQLAMEMGEILSEEVKKNIHAPPGLFGDTHAPESIALSIIADIQSRLGRS